MIQKEEIEIERDIKKGDKEREIKGMKHVEGNQIQRNRGENRIHTQNKK